jgi:hypothetical protein
LTFACHRWAWTYVFPSTRLLFAYLQTNHATNNNGSLRLTSLEVSFVLNLFCANIFYFFSFNSEEAIEWWTMMTMIDIWRCQSLVRVLHLLLL